MNVPKRILGALSAAAILFSLSGCAAGESQSQPLQETVRWAEAKITPDEGVYQLDLTCSEDGTLYLYGIQQNALQAFVSQDGGQTWQKQELSWLDQLSGQLVTAVSRAADGTLLVDGYAQDGTVKNHWRVHADGTVEPIALEVPEGGAVQRLNWVSAQAAFAAVEMPMEGENYTIQTSDASGQMRSAMQYSPTESGVFDLATGKKVTAGVEYPQFFTYCSSGDALYFLSFEGGRQCYQLQSLDAGGTLTVLQEDLTGINGDAALFVDDQKAAYFANSKGVHKLAPGGSKLETIFESSAFAFASPNASIQNLLVLDDGSVLITLLVPDEQGNYNSEVYRYSQQTVSASDETQTLNIWSLYNSDTARAAAVQFGVANPSLNVQYTYALEEGDTAGVEDVLRQLNTELLAGQGPDVLLLDGVDRFEDYAQKGLFADLSPVLDENAITAPVREAYCQEKEVYVFPARFKVPVIFGDAGTVEQLNSLEALRDLIHQWAPRPFTTVDDEAYYTPLEDSQAYAFSFLSLEKLVDFTLQTSMNALLPEGKLDENALRQVLEFIADVGSYYNMDEYAEAPAENITAAGSGGDVVISADELQEYSNCGRARFGRTLMTTPLVIPSEGGRYVGGILSGTFERSAFNAVLQPGLCEGAFLPSCMVAVNAASSHQPEALEYVHTLLSEEIQSVLYEDEGMPVCQAALDASLARAQEAKDWNLYQGDFQTLMDGLKTPVVMNQTVRQHILAYAKDLASGAVSVDDAVGTLSDELSLYLAEQN